MPEEHKFQRQSNVSVHKSHKKQMTVRSQKGRPGKQGVAGNRGSFNLSSHVSSQRPLFFIRQYLIRYCLDFRARLGLMCGIE